MDQNCSHKPLSGNAWRGILRTVLVGMRSSPRDARVKRDSAWSLGMDRFFPPMTGSFRCHYPFNNFSFSFTWARLTCV